MKETLTKIRIFKNKYVIRLLDSHSNPILKIYIIINYKYFRGFKSVSDDVNIIVYLGFSKITGQCDLLHRWKEEVLDIIQVRWGSLGVWTGNTEDPS